MPVGLLDLLAPPACAACSAPVSGGALCAACAAALPWLAEPCPRCALPRPCAPCPAVGAPFSRAWAAVAHAGPARDLVLALKLRGLLAAADAMAAQIAARVPRDLVAGAVLVPVPSAPARRRRRGFDPAGRVAEALGRRIGRPVERWLRTAPGEAARQVGRSRRARLAAGRGRFEAAPGVGRAAPAVVLVDDVHTTGATLAACARALRAAGVGRVVAVTYARTLPPR